MTKVRLHEQIAKHVINRVVVIISSSLGWYSEPVVISGVVERNIERILIS